MSVIPMSRVSSTDLCHLGNNLLPAAAAEHAERLAAVNRSLAWRDEWVDRLFRPKMVRQGRRQAAPASRSAAA